MGDPPQISDAFRRHRGSSQVGIDLGSPCLEDHILGYTRANVDRESVDVVLMNTTVHPGPGFWIVDTLAEDTQRFTP
ncbi:hypothetical protein KHP60_21140 [Microvirga sp. 3-52]|uniref:hypothetical protein n=1 Tax=Microvirga sp. 3-52 TaxID=2792425 RepID=UPI001BD00EE3|nr:hypothetical protein [Microvirga sp. 3-52]MBS7454815.1 hypothetical protein [Microvirga sp. 3-52]